MPACARWWRAVTRHVRRRAAPRPRARDGGGRRLRCWRLRARRQQRRRRCSATARRSRAPAPAGALLRTTLLDACARAGRWGADRAAWRHRDNTARRRTMASATALVWCFPRPGRNATAPAVGAPCTGSCLAGHRGGARSRGRLRRRWARHVDDDFSHRHVVAVADRRRYSRRWRRTPTTRLASSRRRRRRRRRWRRRPRRRRRRLRGCRACRRRCCRRSGLRRRSPASGTSRASRS